MAFSGRVVCLVNRAPHALDVMFDGKHYPLQSGENYVPVELVRYAKNQYPIMGSAHPYSPSVCQYQVGVKAAKGEAQRDDISPLTIEQLQGIERIDRSKLFDQGKNALPIDTGHHIVRDDLRSSGPGFGDATFDSRA